MSPQPKERKKTRQQLEFELKMVVDNIEHAEQNIQIFSDQVEQQKTNKTEYEKMKSELEKNLADMN